MLLSSYFFLYILYLLRIRHREIYYINQNASAKFSWLYLLIKAYYFTHFMQDEVSCMYVCMNFNLDQHKGNIQRMIFQILKR